MKRFDVIVSGGGMIGSVAAVAAINQGFSVLLIEANKFQPIEEKSKKDLRVSAISWENIQYLKKLNIFNHLHASRIQAYEHMKVWDNRGDGKIEFSADFSHQTCLGYLMENNNLIQAAWTQLKSDDRCQIIQQTSIKPLENLESQVRIELNNGETYKSRILIAAEGRNSFVRENVGILCKEKPYNQKGLVAYIQLDKAPEKTALQAFNDGGPIGILPIDKGIYSIVWSLPEEQCQHWLDCTEVQFEKGIQQAISRDLGLPKLLSQRAAFPLSQLNAEKYFQQRTILCGDTAHGVHPLAGQGVNLGIGDIQLLFELLNIETLKDNVMLHSCLRKYQRTRISKIKETSEMMSFIHHLFKDDNHIKNPLRNMGLNLINQSPLKNWFSGQAGS